MYQIITLYILNNVVCQLYFSKAGGNDSRLIDIFSQHFEEFILSPVVLRYFFFFHFKSEIEKLSKSVQLIDWPCYGLNCVSQKMLQS